MLEKFFEAPEPKQAAVEKEDLPDENEDEVLTDQLKFSMEFDQAEKDDSTKEETKDEEEVGASTEKVQTEQNDE